MPPGMVPWQARVLAAAHHVALANRIGEGLLTAPMFPQRAGAVN